MPILRGNGVTIEPFSIRSKTKRVGATVGGDCPTGCGRGHEAGGGFIPIDQWLPQGRQDECFGRTGAAMRIEGRRFGTDGDEEQFLRPGRFDRRGAIAGGEQAERRGNEE